MAEPTSPSARRLLSLGGLALSLAHLVIGGWMLATRGDVLRTAHPALLVLVLVVIALGLLHGALALRRTSTAHRRAAADGDRVRTGSRKARAGSRKGRAVLAGAGRVTVVLLSVLLLAATAWLRPFPADARALSAAVDERVELSSTATTITLRPAADSTTNPAGTAGNASATRTGLIFQPGARVDPHPTSRC